MRSEHDGNVLISAENDIVKVRKAVREVAISLDFGTTDVTRIVTAASELARNVFHYAGFGTLECRRINSGDSIGIELIFEDKGPGIPDIEQAMTMGYTTRGGLGLGLPGAKRLMDELEINSEAGKGTTVIIRKWRNA